MSISRGRRKDKYILPNGDMVDLEIVEDTYPTVEFESETDGWEA